MSNSKSPQIIPRIITHLIISQIYRSTQEGRIDKDKMEERKKQGIQDREEKERKGKKNG